MLVLTRKLNEKILIDDPQGGARIEVVIVKIDRNQVRVGVTAPRHLKILRDELLDDQPEPETVE